MISNFKMGAVNYESKINCDGPKAKQILSRSVWFTIQLPKPKSVSIVLYSILNLIGPVGISNCRIKRSKKKDTFLPITTYLVYIEAVDSHVFEINIEKKSRL